MQDTRQLKVKLPDNCPAHLALTGEIVHIKETLDKLEKKFDNVIYLLAAQLVLIISGLSGIIINILIERR